MEKIEKPVLRDPDTARQELKEVYETIWKLCDAVNAIDADKTAEFLKDVAAKQDAEREKPQPTRSIQETLDKIYEAGGKIWDEVKDPDGLIREMRGDDSRGTEAKPIELETKSLRDGDVTAGDKERYVHVICAPYNYINGKNSFLVVPNVDRKTFGKTAMFNILDLAAAIRRGEGIVMLTKEEMRNLCDKIYGYMAYEETYLKIRKAM